MKRRADFPGNGTVSELQHMLLGCGRVFVLRR
jgi:hypothetical protein